MTAAAAGAAPTPDTAPYAVAREVDDLAALLDRAGGAALVYGFSSGGLVALHAAAAGLPILKLALLEPPIAPAEDRPAQRAFTAGLAELVAAGRPAAAVEYYLSGIGVPEEVLAGMRETPSWSAMVAVAPTLVYDSLVSEATSLDLLAAVAVPTLVLDSAGSSDDLTGNATAVARALPDATHRRLPGAWHGVSDDVLAPALTAFFRR
jgi:pimeloyl-ACP methyl ester carboxylesterase